MSEDQATEPVAAPGGTLEEADQALDAGAAAEVAPEPAVQETPRPPEATSQAPTDAEAPEAPEVVIKRVMAQAAASDARADEIEAENGELKKANHELKAENLKADGVIKGMQKRMNDMMPDTTLHGSIDKL